MVQFTNAAFNNIKLKAPSLIAITHAMYVGVLTNQTFLLHDGSINEDMVPTFFPFPGSWIENLM